MQRVGLVGVISLLVGCGQSGALYLPPPTIPAPVVTAEKNSTAGSEHKTANPKAVTESE